MHSSTEQYDTYVVDSATGWTEETLQSTRGENSLHHNDTHSTRQVKNNVRRSKPSSRVVPVQHAVRSNKRPQLPPRDSDVTAKPSDTTQSYKSADIIDRELDESHETLLVNCCGQGLGNVSHGEVSTETELPDELEVLYLNQVANNTKNESSNVVNLKLDNFFTSSTNSLTPSGTGTRTHPLLTAAVQGDARYLAKLLTSQSAVDVTDVNGRTALMHAAYGGHKDCIKLLLEAGADVNIRASDGSTVLHQVALSGADSILSLLLLHKSTTTALPDSQGRVPLHWAAYAAETKCLSLLLDDCTDTDVTDLQGMTPLMWAAYMSQPDHLEQLMGCGASLALRDNEGMSAIHWSVNGVGGVENRVACFKLLLSHESSCYRDSSGRSVIHYIAETSAEELLSPVLYIRPQAIHDTDAKGRTPLHWASVCNKTDILPPLLRSGGSLAAQDYEGMTALDYAVAKGYKYCIKLLTPNTDSNKPGLCESQIPTSALASYIINRDIHGSDRLSFTLSDLLLLRYIATGCYLQKYTNKGKGPKHRRYFWMNIDSGELCWSKHQNPANIDIRTAVPLEVRPSASLAVFGRKDFDSSFKHQFCFCILCSHSNCLLNLIAVDKQTHSNWLRGLQLYLSLGTKQASEVVRANGDTVSSIEEVLDRIS